MLRFVANFCSLRMKLQNFNKMSTFFEKLTGSHEKTDADAIRAAGVRTGARRSPVRYAMPADADRRKPTRVKVETDDTAPEEAEDQEPIEEEGELTVDIYDKGDSIVIQSTVAGVNPEDLDVSITNDSVTIRGMREREEETHEENYYYKELFWGTFSRSVILPEEIDEDDAEASLKHGLLTIRLPKKRRGVVQKLKVKVT